MVFDGQASFREILVLSPRESVPVEQLPAIFTWREGLCQASWVVVDVSMWKIGYHMASCSAPILMLKISRVEHVWSSCFPCRCTGSLDCSLLFPDRKTS